MLYLYCMEQQHLNNAILFFSDPRRYPRRGDIRNELVRFFESSLSFQHGQPTRYEDYEAFSKKTIKHLLDVENSISSSRGYSTSYFNGMHESIGYIVELTSKIYLHFERFVTITYRTQSGDFKCYQGSYEDLLIQMHRRCLADAYKI